jgi:Regulator of G protein signaling domain
MTDNSMSSEEDFLIMGDYFGEELAVGRSIASYTVTACDPSVVLGIEEDIFLRVILRAGNTERIAELKVEISRENASLEDMLRYPPACAAFRVFLESSYSHESLDFWLAVDRYEARANFIYNGGDASKLILQSSKSGGVRRSNEQFSSTNPVKNELSSVRKADIDDDAPDSVELTSCQKRGSVVMSKAVFEMASDLLKNYIVHEAPYQVGPNTFYP